MVRHDFEVKNYRVVMAQQMGVGGSAASVHAYITCMGPQGERYNVYFLRPDSKHAGNVYHPDEKWASAFVPAEQFPWYLDILRNEKPVYCYLDSEHPQWNRLSTGREPVGEGPMDHGAGSYPIEPEARPPGSDRPRVQ